MIPAKLSEIASAIGARHIGQDCLVSQIYTDSRSNREQGLFVALKGPHYDAHNFLQVAMEQGAKGVLVESPSSLPIPQLVVEDTRLALGLLAKFNRQRLNAKFVAITGSSGKTTVKEMLASILQNIAETYATKGNLNNEIGAPLSILEMNATHKFGVIELGANHAGEIAYTSSIVQPDVALINNVAAAHLEGFGDLQGVARAKGEIYFSLGTEGIAIINNDDDFADFWKSRISNPTLTFSVLGDGDLTASDIILDNDQCCQFVLHFAGNSQVVKLSLAGRHNVKNALAAAACALAINIPLKNIAEGLQHTPIVSGRLMTEMLSNGCRLIDDTYNANLDSMKAAIELLAGYKNRRILVIGDMAELGQFGRQCHEEIGETAKNFGIDIVYSCGVLTRFSQSAFGGEGKHFSNQNELIQQLQKEAIADTTILIKGSRSAHMENIVQAIMDNSESLNEPVASPEGEE